MLPALTDRLRRVTNGRPWIPEIDGLRFVAIASVVLFHLLGEVGGRSGRILPMEPRYWMVGVILGNGDRGVRLFFVISGLVLALPFARHFLAGGKPISLRAYFMRRLTRLEPPYILSVVLFTILFGIYTHGVNAAFVPHFIATLFYLHNPIYGSANPINMVAWSLEIEVQFYLLAPFFMQLFRIPGKWKRRSVFVGLILLTAAPQLLVLQAGGRVSLSIARFLGYFLAGLLAADIFVVDLPMWRERYEWDLVGALCLFAMFTFGHDWEPSHDMLPFVFGLLCLAVMRGPVLRRCVSKPWVAVIGGMCYSIYLMHMTAIAIVFKVSRYLIVPRFNFIENYLVQLLVLVPSVVLAGAGFYLLIERPCMDPQWPLKLKRWFLARRESAVATRS